jgi:hypothetical protein
MELGHLLAGRQTRDKLSIAVGFVPQAMTPNAWEDTKAGRKPLWRQDVDHSDEPLFDQIVGARTTQTRGPIPEFLAEKAAERAQDAPLVPRLAHATLGVPR